VGWTEKDRSKKNPIRIGDKIAIAVTGKRKSPD
jgi:hypothetical protein